MIFLFGGDGIVTQIYQLEQALKQYFGFDEFLSGQREVIDCALAGQDALVLMPTGGGKSLTYQLPALLLQGLTIVVSPLIALMQDQVDRLQANGIAASFLNSTLSANTQSRREHGATRSHSAPRARPPPFCRSRQVRQRARVGRAPFQKERRIARINRPPSRSSG